MKLLRVFEFSPVKTRGAKKDRSKNVDKRATTLKAILLRLWSGAVWMAQICSCLTGLFAATPFYTIEVLPTFGAIYIFVLIQNKQTILCQVLVYFILSWALFDYLSKLIDLIFTWSYLFSRIKKAIFC